MLWVALIIMWVLGAILARILIFLRSKLVAYSAGKRGLRPEMVVNTQDAVDVLYAFHRLGL